MKRKLFVTIFIILIITISKSVYAEDILTTDDLDINEYVYFDPESNGICNQGNYWTYYNQDTSCYRWNVIDISGNNIVIMLDHNIGASNFDNYQTTLNENTKNWKGVTNITIIDESTIKRLKRITDESLPNLDASITEKGPRWMMSNLYFYYNGEKIILDYGYWSKTVYNDDDGYIYTITENGNNRLIARTKTRGIRPVVTVKRSKLTAEYKDHTIYPSLKYKFPYLTEQFNGYTYKQLQGFTFTNDKIVYVSSRANNPENSLLFTQSGENYANRYYQYVEGIGHANDLGYNSRTNQILLTGIAYGESANQVWLYDNNDITKEPEKIQPKVDGEEIKYGSIAYDKYNDYYFGRSVHKIFVLNNNFEPLYTFDAPFLETGQGMEYHNGYLYIPHSEVGNPEKDNGHQLYYRGVDYDKVSDPDTYRYSARMYVYNVKFNKDKTPTSEFGKLVRTYYIPKYNETNETFGEIESASFFNNTMYLGYANQIDEFDLVNTYRFLSYKEDNYDLNYDIISVTENNTKTINISSPFDIKNINSWNSTSDSHSINKSINVNDSIENVNLCDLYSNCINLYANNKMFLNEINVDKNNNVITHINPKTTFNQLKDKMKIIDTIEGVNINSSDNIKTGDRIKMTNNNNLIFKASVTGDFNSDGLADMNDINLIANHIISNSNVEYEKKVAADLNNDKYVKVNDIMILLKKAIS